MNKAVDECIKDGILADFLRDSKAEVVGVSIFEFDREEYEKIILAEEREESEARGEARGRAEGRAEGWLGAFYELVKKKLLSLSVAAAQAGQSEEEFALGMDEYFAKSAKL